MAGGFAEVFFLWGIATHDRQSNWRHRLALAIPRRANTSDAVRFLLFDLSELVYADIRVFPGLVLLVSRETLGKDRNRSAAPQRGCPIGVLR